MNQDKAALRAARKERLAANDSLSDPKKSTTTDGKSPTTAADGKTTDTTKANASDGTAPEKRELTARVLDPTLVGTDAKLEMVLFHEKTANPHWVVFANGEPVFKIALADQEDPDKLRKLFITADYPASIKSAATKYPLVQIMGDVGGRPYSAVMSESAAFKAIENKIEKDKTAEYAKKRASIVDDFRNILNLVTMAQRKNYLSDNPLKSALFRAVQKLGIANPIPVIEEAMLESGDEHFDVIFKQAEKWMGYTPEALADLKSEVMGMDHRIPTAPENTDRPVRSQRLGSIPTEDDNVPLVTTRDEGTERTASPRDQLKSDVRETFSFRRRTLAHDIHGK